MAGRLLHLQTDWGIMGERPMHVWEGSVESQRLVVWQIKIWVQASTTRQGQYLPITQLV